MNAISKQQPSINWDEILFWTANDDAGYRSRMDIFRRWMERNGLAWYEIDLVAYRDWLLQTRKPTTVQVYLATVRQHYKGILHDNNLWNTLYAEMTSSGMSKADAHADLERLRISLSNAIIPESAPVKIIKVRDKADSERGLWLTRPQANELLRQPGLDTLRGMRDTAILAMMLTLGLRESEVANLKTNDLEQTLDGSLAVLIRRGKGSIQRLVPYGNVSFSLTLTKAWMAAAGIESGYVFRGFWKYSKSVRKGKLSVTAGSMDDIVAAYPLVIDGELTTVRPHDLRRTYARLLYDAGMRIKDIADNMGHTSIKTTQIYIGRGSAENREPPAIFDFDIKQIGVALAKMNDGK